MDYVGIASNVQAVGDVEKAVLIRRKIHHIRALTSLPLCREESQNSEKNERGQIYDQRTLSEQKKAQ